MTGPTGSKIAYLGLGSNLGDRRGAMRAAVFALDARPCIRVNLPTGVASLYESAAVVPDSLGGDQPAYLNSALRVETTLSPRELLRAALEIEAALGRVRHRRWAARGIDIDLLLFDDVVTDDKHLTLPHPRLAQRLFVLEPLAEIAGELLHPTLHATVACLARGLADSGEGPTLTRVADPRWVQGPGPAGPRDISRT